MLWSVPVQAELYTIDLSSLGGRGFLLEAALYSASYDPDGSWVMMDNVVCGSATDTFGDEDLGGFDDYLNPDSVKGVWDGDATSGSYVLKIAEDEWFSPTIVLRTYASSGPALSFNLEMRPSQTTGTFDDEFVLSILDPDTLDPLVWGLMSDYYWPGDVLVANAGGVAVDYDPTVVPAPAALLLGLLGFAAGGLGLRRARASLV
jgi:hypothetical protein